MWWDEIMIVAKVDLRARESDTRLKKLVERFRIPRNFGCPAIAFFSRGFTLADYDIRMIDSNEAFTEWIWSKLKISVTFENKTPWKLDYCKLMILKLNYSCLLIICFLL